MISQIKIKQSNKNKLVKKKYYNKLEDSGNSSINWLSGRSEGPASLVFFLLRAVLILWYLLLWALNRIERNYTKTNLKT